MLTMLPASLASISCRAAKPARSTRDQGHLTGEIEASLRQVQANEILG